MNVAQQLDARRAILWSMKRRVPMLACGVLGASLKALARPEEEIGGDLLDALCAMIRVGEIDCSTVNEDRTEIIIGSSTVIALVAATLH